MKFQIEFEFIPAVGVLIGYNKEGGLIIMLPFFSSSIKRIKRKKSWKDGIKI
jgi:hypothetical protein